MRLALFFHEGSAVYKRSLLSGTFFASALICLASVSAPALAEGEPVFSADVLMELQNDYTARTDDEGAEHRNNMFFRTEVAPTVRLGDYFFVDGVLVLEPVQDFDSDEHNFFEETGIFAEEIKLNFERGPWRAFAGKFNPAFGMAWDFGRGIWGEDFAGDYEVTERIGFGGGYSFDAAEAGTHNFTASTFFADTSFLSDSLGVNRGRTSHDDGGVSNTEDFSSLALSLEGGDFANLEGFYYMLSYRHQSEGDADSGGDDEDGFAVTVGHELAVCDRVKLDGFAEYATFSHFDAADEDRNYFTASLKATIDEKWNVTASYTNRHVDPEGADDSDDHLLQLSGGYDFGQGTTVEAGWRHADEEAGDSDVLGLLVRHNFSF